MIEPTPVDEPRSRLRLARLALALVVGVLVATTAAAGVAEAAPPLSLTANPNPVVIPLGQTAGEYTVSWSTGSNLPAELTITVDAGPESARFNQIPAGSAPHIPINFGQTQTWRLYTKGLVRPLKTVVITTKRPDKSCAGTCIKDVQVTPHGTFAEVKVIATAKLKTFELTANKPGEPVSSAMIGWDTQTWNTMLLTLDPGSAYEFTLKVTDESGNSQVKHGSFTTLKRQVTVSYNSITVTDDSDDLSEGDFAFWFKTNGAWDNSDQFVAGIDTGDTVNPGYSTSLAGAPDDLQLGLYGWDDDCGPLDGLCSFGSHPGDGGGYGTNGEAEWNYAFTTVNTLVSGPGESFSAPFSMSTSNASVAFVGSGTYSVTYI